MSDEIDTLLNRFELKARVFFSGQLCGVAHFDDTQGVGHLHLLRQGTLEVVMADGTVHPVAGPATVFVPRAAGYRLRAAEPDGADLICASVAYGVPLGNVLVDELPALLVVALDEQPALQKSLDLLFDEAFSQSKGRGAAVDRLSELVLIHLLRVVLRQGSMKAGVLGGLTDPRLARALHAIHVDAARPWTLEQLAIVAGMSRARFAAQFNQVVGMPPGEYLARWRIGLAQGMLARGRQVKHVAHEVGYGSPAALTRAFVLRTGMAPTEWLAGQRTAPLNEQEKRRNAHVDAR
ncbi:MAG: AraC family transcriptional regulator [Pelomonas sp.]|nr:AraC family transcriptional regulator [Roseateles sp.]